MVSPLEELEQKTGSNFSTLKGARVESAKKLKERRQALENLPEDARAAVVYMGSIGRAEAVDASDDDYMVLFDGPEHPDEKKYLHERVNDALLKVKDFEEPSSSGIFAKPVRHADLVEKIGLSADDNFNTTRRMLFLVESTWAWGASYYEEAFRSVLERYIDESVSDFKPPRFLLNDLVRYWRTMCVDFAGKEFDGSKKWGLQNAKLRTSRKLLFAGGLLPTLECFTLPKSEMVDFLTVEFLKPPLDRIASAFLRHNESDAGARVMTAYDDFLQILDSGEERNKLSSLSRDQARDSELFNKTKDIGGRIESGLLALLFSPGDLSDVSRRYLIF